MRFCEGKCVPVWYIKYRWLKCVCLIPFRGFPFTFFTCKIIKITRWVRGKVPNTQPFVQKMATCLLHGVIINTSRTIIFINRFCYGSPHLPKNYKPEGRPSRLPPEALVWSGARGRAGRRVRWVTSHRRAAGWKRFSQLCSPCSQHLPGRRQGGDGKGLENHSIRRSPASVLSRPPSILFVCSVLVVSPPECAFHY